MAEKESLDLRSHPPTMASRGEHHEEIAARPVGSRLFITLFKSVVVINVLLILINVSTLWRPWNLVSAQTSKPSGLHHQVHNLSPSYPRFQPKAHRLEHWIQMTRRQAPPAGNASSQPLQTFSVDVPLLGLGGKVVGAGTPDGFEGIKTSIDSAVAGCQVTLGVNVFASSFGAPFVGNYTPPSCLGDSNTAVMNLTVQSKGRQFDRLAIV